MATPGPVLLDEARIECRIKELAVEIADAYAGRSLLTLAVLKGSFVFLADLVRAIEAPVEIEFVTLSSYGSRTESQGTVRQLTHLGEEIAGRDVLVVEDIVDSGRTLSHLLAALQRMRPASVGSCAFLNKPARREVTVPIEFIGFEIPDVFVIGYGLDFAGRFRNLPYVAELIDT